MAGRLQFVVFLVAFGGVGAVFAYLQTSTTRRVVETVDKARALIGVIALLGLVWIALKSGIVGIVLAALVAIYGGMYVLFVHETGGIR